MSDKWIAVWEYVPGIDETKHPNFVVKRSEIRREVLETIDRLAKDALSCLPTADNEARSALWQLSVAATARLAANDVPRDPFREAVGERPSPEQMRAAAESAANDPDYDFDLWGDEAHRERLTQFVKAVGKLVGALEIRVPDPTPCLALCHFLTVGEFYWIQDELAKVKALLEDPK